MVKSKVLQVKFYHFKLYMSMQHNKTENSLINAIALYRSFLPVLTVYKKANNIQKGGHFEIKYQNLNIR